MQNPEEEDYFNLAYERCDDYSEIQYKMVECEECNGNGRIYYSDCCGEDVIDDICQNINCLEKCETNYEVCSACTGDGEVEIEC